MANNEITVKRDDLLQIVNDKGIDNLIKPLINEIYLFDSFVANTSTLKDMSVLSELEIGDKLTLKREVSKFDENFIALFSQDNKKVGNVPEKDNVIFARLMDAGKLLSATITDIKDKGFFKQINIKIYLIDF